MAPLLVTEDASRTLSQNPETTTSTRASPMARIHPTNTQSVATARGILDGPTLPPSIHPRMDSRVSRIPTI